MSTSLNIPSLRSDREWFLACLLCEVWVLAENLSGCFASNEYFAKRFGCHPATVRGAFADFERWGLIRRESGGGAARKIVPCVMIEDALAAWPLLAKACSTCRRIKKAVRNLAKTILGKDKYAPKCSPKYAPSLPIKSRRAEEKENTTTTLDAPEADVVVSLLATVVEETEARELARAAKKVNRTPEEIRGVLAAFEQQRGNIKSIAAWLYKGIREGWKPATTKTETTTTIPEAEHVRFDANKFRRMKINGEIPKDITPEQYCQQLKISYP